MNTSDTKQIVPVPRKAILLAMTIAVVFYMLAGYITWVFSTRVLDVADITTARVMEMISLWLVSGLIIVFLEKFRYKGRNIERLFVPLIPVSYILSILCIITNNLLLAVTGLKGAPASWDYLRYAFYYFVPLVLVLTTYAFVIKFYEARYEQDKARQSERLLQEAKWQMLRYQVNPHFLFNALNTIRSMLKDSSSGARQIITELSDYFRFSLAENNSGLIEISKELAAVRNYLEIQRIRFENKLNYQIDQDEQLVSCKVPVFCIQTLVENGVKYGVKTVGFPMNLKISTCADSGSLLIRVMNTGCLYKSSPDDFADQADSTQTGLMNLRSRLEILYGKQASFSLREEKEEVVATLRIPLNYCYETMEGTDH